MPTCRHTVLPASPPRHRALKVAPGPSTPHAVA